MTPRAGRLTLAACVLGSAIVFVDGTVVNVALPALRRDLGASLAEQQWVVESFLLMLGSLVLVGGSLGDLLGRRRVFAAGVAGFGLTSLLCAVAPSASFLIAARAAQGVAGALLVPSSLAIITAAYRGEERGRAIGLWTAWTSAAIAFGPPLGGLLVDAASWRLIFLLNIPLVIAALVIVATAMPPFPGTPGRSVDLLGALLCAAGLGGPVFALIEQPANGWDDPLVWAPFAGGLALLALFVLHEARAPDPMLPLRLFRSRPFSVANIATLAIYAGLGSATFFVAIFLQQVAGYSALAGGLALLPITIALVALSSRWGALSVRLGPRALMTAGPLVAGVGLLALLRVGAQAPYATQVLPGVALFGLGLSMTVAPLTATVLGAVPGELAGTASGVNNAIARVAALLAIAVVGAVVASAFSGLLDDRLRGTALDAPARAAVREARRTPLAPVATPPASRVAARVDAAQESAAVEAFHRGMLLSALLVAAGGALSFALLGPARAPRGGRARTDPA